MNRNAPQQSVPLPPEKYNWEYFQLLVRAFNAFVNNSSVPGDVVGASLTLINPPERGYGLPVGAFWVDSSSKLTMVRETDTFTPSYGMRLAMGRSTVVIS